MDNVTPSEDLKHVATCLNCGKKAAQDDIYCSLCSQKLIPSKISAWSLLSSFFRNLFNWDSKIISSLKKLIIPGQLPLEYMHGQRKKHVNPVRLFVFSLVVFMAVLGISLDRGLSGKISKLNIENELIKSEIYDDYLQLKEQYKPSTSSGLDSLEMELFKNIKRPDEDTLKSGGSIQFLTIELDSIAILRKDFVEMPIDSIFEKYEIHDTSEQFVLTQAIRIYLDQKGVISFLIGNILWVVILSVFVLSSFMMLLYWRNGRYFVEHLIFQLSSHSFVIISFIISMLIILFLTNDQGDFNRKLLSTTTIMSLIYSFISLKRYYGQGYFKTFIKFFILLISYFLIALVCALIVFFISLLVF